MSSECPEWTLVVSTGCMADLDLTLAGGLE